LAGAGGGGFLMMVARDPEAAAALRAALSQEPAERGAFVPYRIAAEGLRVQSGGLPQPAQGDHI
jgi:galactokinase/mevalonate kinase-like predicted kinase